MSFHRLVSFYRQKILTNDLFYLEIKSNAYTECKDKSLKEAIVDHSIYTPNKDFDEIRAMDLSFPAMVRYIIKKVVQCQGDITCLELVDDHFRPMFFNCSPCDVDYDVISEVRSRF